MPPSDAASGPSRSVVNDWLIAEMEERFHADPSSVSADWQALFTSPAHRNGAANGAGGATTSRGLPPAIAAVDPDGPEPKRLRGTAARIVENMDHSLAVPTATSVREVPAKLLEVNRRIINNYLKRIDGGKVSFTHLIAYAMIRALDEVPAMTRRYTEVDGKPAVLDGGPVGVGIAVDMPAADGSRSLVVPVIQDVAPFDFAGFHAAYEALIRRVRANALDAAMFAGATFTITNPGTIGTVLSVPRLMPGQAAILGVGSIDLPAAFQAADPRTIADLGVSKVVTITSTYDHRVIQGAESGAFLKRVHELLIGEHGFYDGIFRALGLPYEPARWRRDEAAQDHTDAQLEKQLKVSQLVNAYRVRGHLIADLDPLRQKPPLMHPELDPNTYGLSIWDLDREFIVEIAGKPMRMELGTILAVLRDAYCRTIGVEFGHVLDPEEKRWLRTQLEGVSPQLPQEDQRWVLERLNAAEAFESFLHTKYVGQKRFGLEGAESLIPLLTAVCERAADEGLEDVVMGMAHRGRLNVLSNVLGKSHRQIFGEFEGELAPDTVQGSGDVKYHLGAHSTYTSRSGANVKLHLPPNPSHLEAVDPVVEGIVRAMQDRYDRGDQGEYPALPLLIHGDAAFAGQGVVFETLHLSQLRGYRTGGTVHVVVNNQVGFTTSPDSSRSSYYATDVAKAVQAPIVHVNADDPEAVVRVARLAFDYRQLFNRDIVIDLVCYRRHGHNEADDPSFTQPEMYRLIEERRSVRRLYTERLMKRGDLTVEDMEDALRDFQERLETAFAEAKDAKPAKAPIARPPVELGVLPPADTAVPRELVDRVAGVHFAVPDGFRRHPKLDRVLERAHERYREGEVDWALGEALAFGTLLAEGTTVRLAGQDSGRGTFSHRHAVQVDFESGEPYVALQHLGDDQGKWFVHDSPLSEYAALGFEYGYSVEEPSALVCWEAQFGDFVNGAQIIIDQFIVAAEDKWGQRSGLVLLLPHGFEGQGPEHSSARIERFLTLCAEDNIQVVNATTAAQYFHVLRRQVRRDVRAPLVVFTPKSLLRSPNTVSHVDELSTGTFREVLDDPAFLPGGAREAAAGKVQRVLLSFGKVAYDLMDERDTRDLDVAVVRVEQLYPFPHEQLAEVLRRYPKAKDVRWVQEEPGNMGAWSFVDGRLWNLLEELGGGRRLRRASRAFSASPAAGQMAVHQQEHALLMDDALA
jgi:multifunctional 2-oxoglutarate metabolism enzyme